MIWLYTGTPGSGKSLHVSQDIYNKIKSGGNVIANFEYNFDNIFSKNKGVGISVDNFELNPQFLLDFAKDNHKRNLRGQIIENQTLLVIDECQLIFNARTWQMTGRSDWCSFFTQHRKYGYNILLVTQFDRLVDRQIRSLVEYELKHRKLNNYKIWGKIFGLLSGGSLFVAVEYWYGVKEKVGSHFFRYSKKYSSMYDSYKIFDANTDKPKKIIELGGKNNENKNKSDTQLADEEANQCNNDFDDLINGNTIVEQSGS